MPAVRKELAEGLAECEQDDSKIICLICSEQSRGRDVIFKRTSRTSHLAAGSHKRALEEWNKRHPKSVQRNDIIEEPPHPITPAAHLTTIEELLNENNDTSHYDNPSDLFDNFGLNDGQYINEDGDLIQFSAGEDPSEVARKELEHQLDNLRWIEHTLFADTGQFDLDNEVDNTSLDHIEEAFQAIGLEDSDDELDCGVGEACSEPSDEWAPHGSKTMFMLDLLDNLPRLRLSDDHMRTIMWVMRECGTPGVPSFKALRKMQKSLTREVAIEPKQHTSSLGNHFYANHPAKLMSLDWANPLVRPHIHVYPELSGPISESYQAEKMTKEADLDELSPMWADWENSPERHFYIKELAQLTDMSFVFPLKWVTVKGVPFAQAYKIRYSLQRQEFDVEDPEPLLVECSRLHRNVRDLRIAGYKMIFSNVTPRWMSGLEHPLREKANGKPMFRLRVMPWSDDVSGNVSKQYNAHTNVYIQNLGIPHRKLQQEYFVRFCSTSQHASSSEQFAALREDFEHDVWHDAYDCQLEQEIMFQIIPHLLPADNPQQSENASHIGVKGQHNCRRDYVGGSNTERESDEGYCAMFCTGRPRRPVETIEAIKSQFRLACAGRKDALETAMTQTGIKDKITMFWITQVLSRAQEEIKARTSPSESTCDQRLMNKSLKGDLRKTVKEEIISCVQNDMWNWLVSQPASSYAKLTEHDPRRKDLRSGDHYNALLTMRGIDPHADTTVEILHTWLLGQEKYVWHETSKAWDDKAEHVFSTRLQSSSVVGLTIPPPRAAYLVRYKNSLIGKHFKVLEQLAIFHIHGLCSNLVFDLWRASGELGAYLWFPEIKDLTVYLVDLQILIDNVLDIWALIDPMRILVKVKLHVLTHLVDDVRRFGPAILFSTEIFECWNAIFRLCSVLSNHQAPSHDIAVTLGDMERFKHQVSGGWWKDVNGHYTRAGKSIRNFLKGNQELQRRLGWVDMSRIQEGTVKLPSLRKRQSARWDELCPDVPCPRDTSQTWMSCKYLVSRSHDICKPGSWVFFLNRMETHIGRIIQIVAVTGTQTVCTDNDKALVVLDQFTVHGKNHRLNMPILRRAGTTLLASPKEILFIFNAQHDCATSSCSITNRSTTRSQERIVSDINEDTLTHNNDDLYLINMHALHNSHLIRASLPRYLTEPRPYLADKIKSRKDIAAQLRILGPAKRAETEKKRAETRARNIKVAAEKQAATAARENMV